MKTLATASKVTVSKVVFSNESASDRRQHQWVITTDADNGSVRLVVSSWQAAVTTLHPQHTPKKLLCPVSGSQTFAAKSNKTDDHSDDPVSLGDEPATSQSSTKKRARLDIDHDPTSQVPHYIHPSKVTEENKIFAQADRVKATKISQQDYWKSHASERLYGGIWQPFTLSATIDGAPVVKTVRTWESLKEHLYPSFLWKGDRQFESEIHEFERLESPKRPKTPARKSRKGKGRQVMSDREDESLGHSQTDHTEEEKSEIEGTGSQLLTSASASQSKTPWRDGNWRSYE